MKLITVLLAVCACYATCNAKLAGFLGFSSIADEAAVNAQKKFYHNVETANDSRRVDPITEPMLLLAEPYSISNVNLTTHGRYTMIRTNFIGGIDYHLGRNRIYWSELGTGKIFTRLLTAKGRESYNVDLLVERSPLDWRPRALAIDYVNDKIYVVDSRGMRVFAYDLDGKNYNVILDGFLEEPMDIVVDPQEGVMFIADGARVLKVNMDGTEAKAVISHPNYYIKSVTLNVDKKEIYWSDNTYHRIKSANYDGSNFNVILKNERGRSFSLLGPANLAYNRGLLYFYDDMLRRIASVKVQSEDIEQKIESTYSIVYDGVTVKAMRLVLPADQQKSVKNPCAANNGLGECENMCLISAKRKDDDLLMHRCL